MSNIKAQKQSVEAPTTARLLKELQQCVREAIDNNRWVVDGRNDPDALLDPAPNDRAQEVLAALARSARAAIENCEWSFDSINKQSAFIKKIERYLETGQSRSSDEPDYALEL